MTDLTRPVPSASVGVSRSPDGQRISDKGMDALTTVAVVVMVCLFLAGVISWLGRRS